MIQFVLDASLAPTHLLEAVALHVNSGELQSLGCVPGLPFASAFQHHSVAISHCQVAATGHEQEAPAVHGGVAGPGKMAIECGHPRI